MIFQHHYCIVVCTVIVDIEYSTVTEGALEMNRCDVATWYGVSVSGYVGVDEHNGPYFCTVVMVHGSRD